MQGGAAHTVRHAPHQDDAAQVRRRDAGRHNNRQPRPAGLAPEDAGDVGEPAAAAQRQDLRAAEEPHELQGGPGRVPGRLQEGEAAGVGGHHQRPRLLPSQRRPGGFRPRLQGIFIRQVGPSEAEEAPRRSRDQDGPLVAGDWSVFQHRLDGKGQGPVVVRGAADVVGGMQGQRRAPQNAPLQTGVPLRRRRPVLVGGLPGRRLHSLPEGHRRQAAVAGRLHAQVGIPPLRPHPRRPAHKVLPPVFPVREQPAVPVVPADQRQPVQVGVGQLGQEWKETYDQVVRDGSPLPPQVRVGRKAPALQAVRSGRGFSRSRESSADAVREGGGRTVGVERAPRGSTRSLWQRVGAFLNIININLELKSSCYFNINYNNYHFYINYNFFLLLIFYFFV